MRTGQFDVAIKRLGDANRELRASLVEDWSELLPSSLDGDMLPAAVELAADTLSQLENPDLRFWTRVLLTVPGDQLGVPHPDELLLAAGELALNLHRTAGLVNKPEPEERRQLLESADKHYRSLFNGLHPQAAGCRRLLGRIDQGE